MARASPACATAAARVGWAAGARSAWSRSASLGGAEEARGAAAGADRRRAGRGARRRRGRDHRRARRRGRGRLRRDAGEAVRVAGGGRSTGGCWRGWSRCPTTRSRRRPRRAGRRAATWPSWRRRRRRWRSPLLAAVGTVAGLRYWAAGLSGSGGFDALEGPGADGRGGAVRGRVAVAVRATRAELSNAAARGLLGSGSVLEDTSRLLGLAFAIGGEPELPRDRDRLRRRAAVSGAVDVQDRRRARARRWCSWRCRWPWCCG